MDLSVDINIIILPSTKIPVKMKALAQHLAGCSALRDIIKGQLPFSQHCCRLVFAPGVKGQMSSLTTRNTRRCRKTSTQLFLRRAGPSINPSTNKPIDSLGQSVAFIAGTRKKKNEEEVEKMTQV